MASRDAIKASAQRIREARVSVIVLCARVPYVASTTLVHRYVVNSNATPFITSHLSQNTAIKLALELDPV
jgi:hypothetical protein